MLTKTRTIFTALLVSASFAGAVAPAISQAQPTKEMVKAGTCELLRLSRELWNEAANRAEANGQKDLAKAYRAEADNMVLEATIYHCAWLADVIVTVPVHVPVGKIIGTNRIPPSVPAVKKAIAQMRLHAAQK